ncbi:tyrosine-type recombinase/integrase [Blautia sp. LMAG:75]|uniref:tyrosine-type recombinase/integrase n=1 Tax=Blautia sp. LMAG:75 TaxID=1969171 RepID=UPI0025C3E364|nr:tyrosine-type recombinase/integrase [Blautia sp. LMAG:75]
MLRIVEQRSGSVAPILRLFFIVSFKDFLFTTKFNTPVIEQTFIDAIDRIIDEINSVRDIFDEFERITPHALRHTFCSRCFEKGITPKVVQQLMGHAHYSTTIDI